MYLLRELFISLNLPNRAPEDVATLVITPAIIHEDQTETSRLHRFLSPTFKICRSIFGHLTSFQHPESRRRLPLLPLFWGDCATVLLRTFRPIVESHSLISLTNFAKMMLLRQEPSSSMHDHSMSRDEPKSQKTHTVTRLSAWDQASMRSYIRVVLCFPFDNAARSDAANHIEESLKRLARQRPDFAGTLEVHSGGIVHLRTASDSDSGGARIPFSMAEMSSQFAYRSFDELKAAEFPPAAFVGPQFNVPCTMIEGYPGVPVAVVRAFTISGGLFLGVYFNHAMADGDCLRIFLQSLAGQTCQTPVPGVYSFQHYVPPLNNLKNDTNSGLEELLKRIPEYLIMDGQLGPTMPRLRAGGVPMEKIDKAGKIFVFNNDRLNTLRCLVAAELAKARDTELQQQQLLAVATAMAAALKTDEGSESKTSTGSCGGGSPTSSVTLTELPSPSNYTCLAALTWACVTRARLTDKNKYIPCDSGVDKTALLQTMVNWKTRAFKEKNANYFGNATAVAATRVSTNGLLIEAASDLGRLAELVVAIETTINSVDESFVQDRTELFNRVKDPRKIGLRFDPRTPQDLGFNTWRFFGADTQWVIPGVGTEPTAPAALRRMQDAWNMSGALILPAKTGSIAHELLVTLPKSSMELLCQDPDWMCWVDRVIG